MRWLRNLLRRALRRRRSVASTIICWQVTETRGSFLARFFAFFGNAEVLEVIVDGGMVIDNDDPRFRFKLQSTILVLAFVGRLADVSLDAILNSSGLFERPRRLRAESHVLRVRFSAFLVRTTAFFI